MPSLNQLRIWPEKNGMVQAIESEKLFPQDLDLLFDR
jgi:hypothetical protein